MSYSLKWTLWWLKVGHVLVQSSYTKRITPDHTLIKLIRIGYKASSIGVAGSWNTRPHRSNPNPYPYPHTNRNSYPFPSPNPEGPYTNVLDLQMFPAMSKRHSELLQMYSNNEANAERIWKAACQVWKSCSSSMVSRAFVLRTCVSHHGNDYWTWCITTGWRMGLLTVTLGVIMLILSTVLLQDKLSKSITKPLPHSAPPYGSNGFIYHVFLFFYPITYIWYSLITFIIFVTPI